LSLRPLRAVAAYDDVLADPEVDVVYIALHNSAHRPWVQRALAAGKHVLCEKPLGLSAAEVDAMADCARENGRLLVEAAWNLWHPRTRAAERILAARALGAVRHVVARFDGASPPVGDYRRDAGLGGGALYDVGCYAVAAVLAAYGWKEPVAAQVHARTWPGGATSW